MERKQEVSGGLSLYIPRPGYADGGIAVEQDDTRGPDRGARVSARTKHHGGAKTSRPVINCWIW